MVVRRAADYLARHEVEAPLATAEVLLARVLGRDRSGLYARDAGLTAAEAKAFGRMLCRRCAGVPLQHLTGEQGFRRLTLVVRPDVFIPRPETEVVVERALMAIEGTKGPVVVDVGTGTGAIALAVKDERPDARVLATDLSPEAVALARENARRLHLAIEVFEGNLLEPLPAALLGDVDLVVGNPPYLRAEDLGSLPREVRAEPPLALVATEDIYGRLFDQARAALRPGGAVVVEIEETQAAAVVVAASAAGFVACEVTTDLAGRDRVVVARASG